MTRDEVNMLAKAAEALQAAVKAITAISDPKQQRYLAAEALQVAVIAGFGAGFRIPEFTEFIAQAHIDIVGVSTGAALDNIVATHNKPVKKETSDGKPPELPDNPAAPGPISPVSGQHSQYWVLSAEDRARGFVRPVRYAYRHVGAGGPKYPLKDLSPEQAARYRIEGYVKWEEYPKNPKSAVTGRYWSQKQLDEAAAGACNAVTNINSAEIAETYARDPKFYGATFCVDCCGHYPVSEFVWEETGERVGT